MCFCTKSENEIYVLKFSFEIKGAFRFFHYRVKLKDKFLISFRGYMVHGFYIG